MTDRKKADQKTFERKRVEYTFFVTVMQDGKKVKAEGKVSFLAAQTLDSHKTGGEYGKEDRQI